MTVQELMQRIECEPPEAEVRIAIQPHYPLQSRVRGVASSTEIEGDEDGGSIDGYTGGKPVVWLVESSQVSEAPYAPRSLWDEAYV